MEAAVLLEKSLFTSYSYNPPPADPSAGEDAQEAPMFEINLPSLLETLNIFGLSDPSALKRPGGGGDYDAFAAHRLSRHAGINTFANPTLGVTGVCTFAHAGHGSPLSIHMSEAGVTTTCDLTTYDAADSAEEIPFAREHLALKAILRASHLLDAVAELSTMNPATVTVSASPGSGTAAGEGGGGGSGRGGDSSSVAAGAATTTNLSFSASGPLGSATVDFTTKTTSDTPALETFYCPAPTRASFKFALLKAAQRAMASAAKVSVRLDDEGVLSLQFLVEVNAAATGADGDGVAFVDFRMVPLLEGDEDGDDGEETGSEA